MLLQNLPHPFVGLASLFSGGGTAAMLAEGVTANPNLAAVAMICGSIATVFSAVVAIRHPRKKSRQKRGSTQPKKSPDNGAKQ